MRQISAFDLDRTLIKANSSALFLRYLYKKKLLSFNKLISVGACYLLHQLRFLNTNQLYQAAFSLIFKKFSLQNLEEIAKIFVEQELKSQMRSEVFHCYENAKQRGDILLIFSCSPSFIVKPFAELIGSHDSLSSSFEVDKDGLVCKISTVVDGKRKSDALKQWSSRHEISKKDTFAYSDSILDLKFLEEAGNAVAVFPDVWLRKASKKRGWKIIE